MEEPHLEDPTPEEPTGAEADVAVDQTQEDEIDEATDPLTLQERLESVTHKIGEHKVLAAATVVGAAAVAVAAILIAQKNSGLKDDLKDRLRTPDGHRLFIGSDRHNPDVISLVEMTEPGGAATDISASFPKSTRAAEAIQQDPNYKKLFAMSGQDGFAYPLIDNNKGTESEHTSSYRNATQRAARWLLCSFKTLSEQPGKDSGS